MMVFLIPHPRIIHIVYLGLALYAYWMIFSMFIFVSYQELEKNDWSRPSRRIANYVESLSDLLRRTINESQGTWRCRSQRQRFIANSSTTDRLFNDTESNRPTSSCRLTPELLVTVSAAHPSVYSRTGIDCQSLFAGRKPDIAAARRSNATLPRDWKSALDEYVNVETGELLDCATFREKRGYFSQPLSQEEAEFPIAFSLLVYSNAAQVERLLRAIYMPQNYYCIHVDLKTDKKQAAILTAIADCFDNVFIATRLAKVYWGHISILWAEMNCIRDLLQYQWKYLVNLSGFMFPVHSNRHLVRVLKLYDGANDIEGSYNRSADTQHNLRHWFSWQTFQFFGNDPTMVITPIFKSRLPHNMTFYKGSNQAALTRAFVVYLMYSQPAKDLLEWFSDTWVSDEHFWPTINHNTHLHAPGSYKGDLESKPFTMRASVWDPSANQAHWSWPQWTCQGKQVRLVCILGVGDLPWVYNRPELFVNKFYAYDFEPIAFDCTEELVFNRTIEDATRRADDVTNRFNNSYYKSLPFVRYKKSLVVSLNETLEFINRTDCS